MSFELGAKVMVKPEWRKPLMEMLKAHMMADMSITYLKPPPSYLIGPELKLFGVNKVLYRQTTKQDGFYMISVSGQGIFPSTMFYEVDPIDEMIEAVEAVDA